MPMLRVFTNAVVDKTFQQDFLKAASKVVATELRKPESYVTVALIPNTAMLFGASDAPCAQAYLLSLGGLDASVNSKISNKLSKLFEKYLQVPSDRYYIQFVDADGSFIGYDGETF
ncbi:hypothetical protein WA158_001665 [Blastocystis sp. Blastoise]